MRKSEITPELIELSKKAKELGFPQDVEEGDWIYIPHNKTLMHIIDDGRINLLFIIELQDNWHSILSFSQCLEWLKERGVVRVDIVETERKVTLWVVFEKGLDKSLLKPDGKTHHEAIAKAVVKILEGD